MTQQMGEDPRALDRRKFLKRAALGLADALETAARFAGAPGLGPRDAAGNGGRLDQPDPGAEDPMFLPAQRRTAPNEDQRRPESKVDSDGGA